jgi:hypothetical protein
MSRDEFRTANRRNWDERVAIHRRDATGFYGVERFLAGEKRLYAIDSGELGEIAGKRLIHLQCHFGLDTLILARGRGRDRARFLACGDCRGEAAGGGDRRRGRLCLRRRL